MESTILLGYPVHVDNEIKWSKNQQVINTLNPHSYVLARTDVVFKDALKASDFLAPDGIGIVLAVRWLNSLSIKKMAGSDIHQQMLVYANSNQLKVFYLGSSEDTLSKIEKKLALAYPNINVRTYSPPFKIEFSEKENETMIQAVNDFQPDILFVGMTAPKQEKWVYKHKASLQVKTICCIGAVFDFYAETVNRPPAWVIILGLEWFGRFIKEPRRMWRRNFISTPIFIFDVFKEKIKRFKQKH